MSGTKIGAAKAKETMLKTYGKNYFKDLGKLGGSKTMAQGAKPKGFAANIELARLAGQKGGIISRRGKKNA